MSKPTPDTSPGDELDEILETMLDDSSFMGEIGPESEDAKERAKDRLNRLMLTEQKRALEKLAVTFSQTHGVQYPMHLHRVPMEEPLIEIADAIAAMDAQLNKEEK